jgi:hypothetical protein
MNRSYQLRTSTDPAAMLPADYTFTSTDAGKHTFTATLKTVGVQSITATDKVHGTIKGTTTLSVQAPVVGILQSLLDPLSWVWAPDLLDGFYSVDVRGGRGHLPAAR